MQVGVAIAVDVQVLAPRRTQPLAQEKAQRLAPAGSGGDQSPATPGTALRHRARMAPVSSAPHEPSDLPRPLGHPGQIGLVIDIIPVQQIAEQAAVLVERLDGRAKERRIRPDGEERLAILAPIGPHDRRRMLGRGGGAVARHRAPATRARYRAA